ncbi:hypothetical protein, partial [Bifidobacterium adolescentis]|uniref:hypothetical protein n=2 Tax=Bifidobacterium adolescentis TaxID=1680 RepID=UPI003BB53DE8
TENRTQDAGHARFNISTKNKTESAQEFGRYRFTNTFDFAAKHNKLINIKKTTRVGGIPSNVRYKKRYKTPSKRIRAPNKSGPLKSDGGILIANNQNVTVENQYNQANRNPCP